MCGGRCGPRVVPTPPSPTARRRGAVGDQLGDARSRPAPARSWCCGRGGRAPGPSAGGGDRTAPSARRGGRRRSPVDRSGRREDGRRGTSGRSAARLDRSHGRSPSVAGPGGPARRGTGALGSGRRRGRPTRRSRVGRRGSVLSTARRRGYSRGRTFLPGSDTTTWGSSNKREKPPGPSRRLLFLINRGGPSTSPTVRCRGASPTPGHPRPSSAARGAGRARTTGSPSPA